MDSAPGRQTTEARYHMRTVIEEVFTKEATAHERNYRTVKELPHMKETTAL